MDEVIFDTTFLIDLQRRHRNEKRIKAEVWLQSNPNSVIKIPAIVLGEFAAGFATPDASEIVELQQRHEILFVGVKEAKIYAEIFRKLKATGVLIGGNDLWIAAIALAAGLPLVTRNTNHFNRI